MLTHSMQLTRVSLRGCGIQDGLCDYLAGPLIINKRLLELDLTGNELTDRGIYEMCRQLETAKKIKLKCLKLNSNNITNHGAIRLLECLRQNKAHTEEVCLADNGLTEPFAKFLADYLKTLRDLEIFTFKRFDLSGNGIGIEGSAIVERELKRNQQAQFEHDQPIEEAKIIKMKLQAKQRKRFEHRSGRAQSELTYTMHELD